MDLTITWELELTRQSGRPLPLEDIETVVVSLSADGQNFSTVGRLAATDPQTVTVEGIENGDWTARFIVVDTDGRSSTPQDFSIAVDDTPPSGVKNVELVLE